MTSGPARLEVRGLGIERGLLELVHALSFEATAGELVQLAGPNGSGKTTVMRCLAGLVTAAGGTIAWNGSPAAGNPDFLAALNYVGHHNGLSAELTAAENLDFIAALAARQCRTSVADALHQLAARAFAERPVRQLSAGQRQRVALARLVLFEARLWMLDEPFTALDRAGRALLETLIDAHLDHGGIVIIATHQNFTSRHARTEIPLGGSSP